MVLIKQGYSLEEIQAMNVYEQSARAMVADVDYWEERKLGIDLAIVGSGIDGDTIKGLQNEAANRIESLMGITSELIYHKKKEKTKNGSGDTGDLRPDKD